MTSLQFRARVRAVLRRSIWRIDGHLGLAISAATFPGVIHVRRGPGVVDALMTLEALEADGPPESGYGFSQWTQAVYGLWLQCLPSGSGIEFRREMSRLEAWYCQAESEIERRCDPAVREMSRW